MNGEIKYFTTSNGLSNNTIYNILKDKKGYLWLSTNQGISRFDPKTGSFRNFGQKDGLRIVEFNSEAACLADDGHILFGGIGGVVGFYPDSLDIWSIDNKDRLLFTEIRVSNIPVRFDKPLYELSQIGLSKGTDNFQIAFADLDYKNSDTKKFRYYLDGLTKTWTLTDSKHQWVNYTSLKPGKFTFYLEAADLNGKWTNLTALGIIIPPFFYQTIWFRITLVIVALGIIAILFYQQLRHVKLLEHKKKEELKLETLRGQMNPHFIYNSLNSINYFISLNDRLNANQYISDFSRLMRSILSNSAKEFCTVEKEIQTLKDYLELEHIRFSDKFDYIIEIDDRIDIENSYIAPSMVQAFAENAIWHGLRYLDNRKGHLKIVLSKVNSSYLTCVIEDDGIGRKLSVQRKTDEQKRRRSRGIAIIQERMRILNSMNKMNLNITIEDLFPDREETGTRVRIEIPVRDGN